MLHYPRNKSDRFEDLCVDTDPTKAQKQEHTNGLRVVLVAFGEKNAANIK